MKPVGGAQDSPHAAGASKRRERTGAMTEREHPQGFCAYCDAVEAFEAWVAVNDPDGSMTLQERINAYAAAKR